MITSSLTPDFFAFINDNASEDVSRLRMKYHNSPAQFDISLAIDNIECRRKCRNKLPNFINKGGVFPDCLASEQSTDEVIAGWHSSFINANDRVADMTAGLGIDAMAIASKAKSVHAFDISPIKTAALIRNASLFSIDNLKVDCMDSVKGLNAKFDYDVVFVDPARRGEGNQRIYDLSSTVPDIIPLISEYVEKKARVYIKCSPMMDMSRLSLQVPYVRNLYAVSHKGECKEVFLECNQGEETPIFHAVDISDNAEINILTSRYNGYEQITENFESIEFADKWLYEPSPAIMKLQPWRTLIEKFPGLKKLSPNTHLFISDADIIEFPGKKRKICKQVSKKEMKELKGKHINVVCRNYPTDPKTLCKKYGLKDGGTGFLYACRYSARELPIMLLCESDNPS